MTKADHAPMVLRKLFATLRSAEAAEEGAACIIIIATVLWWALGPAELR